MIALCAFPVVRGLTRRLERLQAGVETLGSGNLTTRVKVEGCDEVAGLAESFNRAAARIEELVNAHRLMLAHASHEIRTPLSRIRLGIEMLAEKNDPKYKAALSQDIAELDALVDDILLASRLDMIKVLPQPEHVDLLGLVAEEASHYDDCDVDGEPVTVTADRRYLRHMIRNLLDNATRHGKPPVTRHCVACGHRRAHRCAATAATAFRTTSASACSCRSSGSRANQGLRPRDDAGAWHRAAAWRRRGRDAVQRARQLHPHHAADDVGGLTAWT